MQSAPRLLTEPRTNSRASYIESPRFSPASPSTTRLPAWAMKALMAPISPLTTMSMPFIEIPQRAAALPSMTRRPPCPVAPADWLASPVTRTMPRHQYFSATPVPALPRTITVPCLFMPAQ